MATSSKRAYIIPRSAVPRAPAPAAGHCWPILPQETLKHSSVLVSVGSLGPGAYKFYLSPSSLWKIWDLILNVILPLLPSYWGFSFALGCGVSLFGVIQHSRVNGYSATSCNFGVLAGEDGHTSFYSAILDPFPKSKYKLFVVRIKCIYNLKLFFFCIVTFDLKKNNTEPLCLKYRTASQICCVYITNCLPDHEWCYEPGAALVSGDRKLMLKDFLPDIFFYPHYTLSIKLTNHWYT